MKSFFSTVNAVIIIIILTSSASLAIVKCVGPDGDVIYTNSTCPSDYRMVKVYSFKSNNTQKQTRERAYPNTRKSYSDTGEFHHKTGNGIFNSNTGEIYPSTGDGYFNPDTGEIYHKTGNELFNPNTGEIYPSIGD